MAYNSHVACMYRGYKVLKLEVRLEWRHGMAHALLAFKEINNVVVLVSAIQHISTLQCALADILVVHHKYA